MSTIETTKLWYDESYGRFGLLAQRRYPNEELLRFFGRHYFSMPAEQRRLTRMLEMGCGSGANLWMMAREGFDTYGIDLSPNAIDLCVQMLKGWSVSATLKTGSMTACPYPNGFFDTVVDVFSAYCLDEADFGRFLNEVSRLLRPGGLFFSYTPSKASDAFRDAGPSLRIDGSTLNGIHRETSAYYGNFYPFRFISREEYETALAGRGLRTIYNETTGRTSRNGNEYFEFVAMVAEKSEGQL